MADLVQTAADVALVDNVATTKRVQFGEAVLQGMPVYLKSSDRKHWKSQHDGTQAEAAAIGITIDKAAADGWGFVVTSGKVIVGATLVVGQTYCVSNTSGAICPISDIATGDWVTILGVAVSVTELDLDIHVAPVQRA